MKKVLEKMRGEVDDDIIDILIENLEFGGDSVHNAICWQQLRDLKKLQTQSAFEDLVDDDV